MIIKRNILSLDQKVTNIWINVIENGEKKCFDLHTLYTHTFIIFVPVKY